MTSISGRSGERALCWRILNADEIVRTVEEKQKLAAEYDALAVDLKASRWPRSVTHNNGDSWRSG